MAESSADEASQRAGAWLLASASGASEPPSLQTSAPSLLAIQKLGWRGRGLMIPGNQLIQSGVDFAASVMVHPFPADLLVPPFPASVCSVM